MFPHPNSFQNVHIQTRKRIKILLIYKILYLERILLFLRKLISIETYRIYLYDYDEVQKHSHETLLHLFLCLERFGLKKQLQNGPPRKYVDQHPN